MWCVGVLCSGNKDFYEDDALELRRSLRRHPKIIAQIDRFWSSYGKEPSKFNPNQLVIPMAEYIKVYLLMVKALYKDFHIESVRAAAREDWLLDTAGTADHTYLDYPRFRRSMFEIADLWTNSLKADKYVEFLSKLYERITRRTQVTEWKKLKNVISFALTNESFGGGDKSPPHPTAGAGATNSATPKSTGDDGLTEEQRAAEAMKAAALARQQEAIDRLLKLRADHRAASAAANHLTPPGGATPRAGGGGDGASTDIAIDPTQLPRPLTGEDDADLRRIAKHDAASAQVRKLFQLLDEKERGVRTATEDLAFEKQIEEYYAKVAADKLKADANAKLKEGIDRENRKQKHDEEMKELTSRFKRRLSLRPDAAPLVQPKPAETKPPVSGASDISGDDPEDDTTTDSGPGDPNAPGFSRRASFRAQQAKSLLAAQNATAPKPRPRRTSMRTGVVVPDRVRTAQDDAKYVHPHYSTRDWLIVLTRCLVVCSFLVVIWLLH